MVLISLASFGPSMADRWVEEHRRDPYTRRAKAGDLRSRSAFKLQQINKRFRVMHRGDAVLDLGCAPGGWSQVATGVVGPKGIVVGVDLDEVEPMPGFIFVRGDLQHETTQAAARACLAGRTADVVLSDMSPNISGTYGLDHFRSMQLAKLAVDFGMPLLAEGGHLVIKVFEGADVQAFVSRVRTRFGRVKRFRPDATRKASSEAYVVALGHDGHGTPEWAGFLEDEEDEEEDWPISDVEGTSE
jgi:23S rRNA (uridine2552-2'-O)-methyltransferase